jgi:hypothetical protein
VEVLGEVMSWGSPLGISLFFFFSSSGAGVLLWGISPVTQSDKEDNVDVS